MVTREVAARQACSAAPVARAIAGGYQPSAREAGAAAGLQIACRIANDPACAEVDPDVGGGSVDHARRRLAAGGAAPRQRRAGIHGVNSSPGSLGERDHTLLDRGERLPSVMAAIDPRLVGDDDHAIAAARSLSQALEGAGDRHDLVGTAEIVNQLDKRAVAVEEEPRGGCR